MTTRHSAYCRPAVLKGFVLILLVLVLSGCNHPKGPGLLPTKVVEQAPSETAFMPSRTETVSISAIETGAPLPPKLLERYPERGQELPLNGMIKLVFDQDMDAVQTERAWQMTDSTGGAISGKVTWLTPRTFQFEPDQPLTAETKYLATLSTEASGAQGVRLVDPLKFEFITTTGLQVSQVFPADGTYGIENTAVITVIFNRPVVPLVVAEQQDTLPNPIRISPAVPGKGEWINTSIFAFRPETYLSASTTYTVSVRAGLKDASGETELAEDYRWHFTVLAPGIDSFWMNGYPWDVNPQDGKVNVALNQGFTIKFLQPMDRSSSEAALSIRDKNGEGVPLTVAWDELGTTMVFTPTQRLALGTAYTLRLEPSAQALGGGNLKKGLIWNFTTVLPPAIAYTEPEDGSVQSEFTPQFSIHFVSQMRIETLKDKVIFTPALEGDWQWYYYDYGVYGDTWTMYTTGLQPSTTYTVQILPGMEDLYGNKISEGKTLRFTTGAYPPSVNLQLPYEGPVIYRVGGPQNFYVSSRNIKDLSLRLYRLPVERFAAMQLIYGEDSPWNYLPVENDLVWKLTEFTPRVNGGQLVPGFYILTLDSPQVIQPYRQFDDVRLVAVISANLSFKTTNTEVLVWVTDLGSGDPLAGAPVRIYNTRFEPIGEGTTDEDGLVYLNKLVKGVEWYDTFFALSEDPKSFGFAAANWTSGVSPYDFGIWQDYYSQPGRTVAYLYTDRPLYRPGQPVYFKGILRVDDDLKYNLPEDNQVNVTIESFEETVYAKTLPLSSYISFEG